MEELIEKYYRRELTAKERLQVLRKVQSDELWKAEMIRRQQLQALLELAPHAGDGQLARDGYRRFMLERRRIVRRGRLLQALPYAAAVACLVVAAWSFTGKYRFPEKNGITARASLLNTLHVPAGQRVSLTLQDGTVVWLNAQTSLTYPVVFSEKERRVTLEGEAWFEVAKNTEKPFVVTMGEVEVKALGTAFNLHGYPQEPYKRISLVEGSVAVSLSGNAAQRRTLRPGEEAVVQGDRMKVASIPNMDYFLWTEGIYSFENETLEKILKALELYYDIAIEVKDPAMLQWKYTVKFRQRDGIREILRLMQRVHRFTMKIDDENNRITVSR
ncbi:MAG: FecR domain-containing protein [Tannerella sp.]|jgi:ferric-dicitrate binding protein FerR (iron transport regulator)|nr:FecR domain-containing protein [Tannerella sp.]